MGTRDRILHEALDLFSVNGYDSVSVRDIAGTVGIKESSLYNHFKNKRDIFDSIVREFSDRGERLFREIDLTGECGFAVDQRTIELYAGMDIDRFAELSGMVFDFYFADEISVKLRRMLTIEQYRSGDIAKIYRALSFDNSIEYQSRLFSRMMNAGLLVKADPDVLALEFFSPVFLIFYKFDNNADSLLEARELFLRHVRRFYETYGVKSHSNSDK